jgi:integrase
MRGSLRHRGQPGSWEFRLELGEQPAQRCETCNKRFWLDRKPLAVCPTCGGELLDVVDRRERTQSGFRTQKAAQAALDKAKVAVLQGDYVEPSKLTVRDYLELWLPTLEATLRPATLRSYRDRCHNHIAPRIGGIPLQKLSPDAIGAMYADLLREGRQKRDGATGPLAGATVRLTHVVLHKALKDAVKRGRLIRNPADAVDPPRGTTGAQNALHVWTGEQVGAFLAATHDDRNHALWRLLATTGMRRGEALGLCWSDVDLEAGRLSVRRALITVGYKPLVSETKTGRSRRSIALDPETVEALKAQAARQLAEQQEWGEAWTDSGYCFTDESGQALHPDRTSGAFNTAVRAAMLPRIRLHDLRHTWATLALQAGIHPKVVSERLGHATISITLDTYSHAIPAMQESAAALVAALIDGTDGASE